MTYSARTHVSTLHIVRRVDVNRPDWPTVTFLVNGRDAFEFVAPGWSGFDSDAILGLRSPLLPTPEPQRVAVYRCSCGEPGCGSLAPLIAVSDDGWRVCWTDFRRFVGVFDDPGPEQVAPEQGRPCDLEDLCFERDQYLTEIERASKDRSSETPRRITARLLAQRLRPVAPVLPSGIPFHSVWPDFETSGLVVEFSRYDPMDPLSFQQELLTLTSRHAEPERAADDMAGQLLAADPADWSRLFGGR